MTDTATSRRRLEHPAPPRIRRTVELWLTAIAIALSVLALGGFSLVMNQIDAGGFEEVIMPALLGEQSGMSLEHAFEAGRTLGAWFGVTLIAVLLLASAGIFFTRRRPWRRASGWWFLAAGLACLLGSQLILFPLAFVYFAVAGLFALRPLHDGIPS